MERVLKNKLSARLVVIISAIILVAMLTGNFASAAIKTVVSPSGTGYGANDQCVNDGWRTFEGTPGPFKNQGDCVSFFATQGTNPANGQ